MDNYFEIKKSKKKIKKIKKIKKKTSADTWHILFKNVKYVNTDSEKE